MTMCFYRCGQCVFFMHNRCINLKSLSFGENILNTYFSCNGVELKEPRNKEAALFQEKKTEGRKSKTV